MEKMENSWIFDRLWERLLRYAEEPEDLDTDECRTFMEVCAAAAQRGSADQVIAQNGKYPEFAVWRWVREMMDNIGIELPVYEFVRESVQVVLNAWEEARGEN